MSDGTLNKGGRPRQLLPRDAMPVTLVHFETKEILRDIERASITLAQLAVSADLAASQNDNKVLKFLHDDIIGEAKFILGMAEQYDQNMAKIFATRKKTDYINFWVLGSQDLLPEHVGLPVSEITISHIKHHLMVPIERVSFVAIALSDGVNVLKNRNGPTGILQSVFNQENGTGV